MRAAGAVAASSLLSTAACYVPGGLGARYGAGLAFGALVLAPRAAALRARGFALLASLAIYRGAVFAADALHTGARWPAELACAFSGALGALLLALAARRLLGPRPRPAAAGIAALVGAAAGASIGHAFEVPDTSPLLPACLLVGYALWQFGFAGAHAWLRAAPGPG